MTNSTIFSRRIAGMVSSLFLVCLLAAPVQSFAQTEAELQQKFLRFLDRDMGIEGWVDSDGDVQFEYNERTYFIEVNEGDPEFFRLVLFNIWPIESASEAIEVLGAVDAVNREMKVIKAYTLNDNVWIAMEVFLNEVDDFESFFQRGLNVIDSAVETFVENM